jgi:hypothetical protein
MRNLSLKNVKTVGADFGKLQQIEVQMHFTCVLVAVGGVNLQDSQIR